MIMASDARNATDKRLAEMESHLTKIYSRAYDELRIRWDEVLRPLDEEIEKYRRQIDAAENNAERINAKKKYASALKSKTLMDSRFRDVEASISEQLAHINETALSYINGELPDVYALNYNDTGRGIEGEVQGFTFDLVDADTVRILAAEDPTLLPEKTLDIERDKKWNVQKMNAEILQGIIQGEAIPEMANRLQNVTDMNRDAAVRNARTMVTGAENRGRLEAQKRAEADGVILEREWISAHDGRTRDLHAELDGQTRKIGKPFEVGGYSIMYPGDPSAAPEMVYNCRCTTGTAVKGFKNPVTGKTTMI